MIFTDRVNLVLALIPILIGIVIYIFFGTWFFEIFLNNGKLLIDKMLPENQYNFILHYILLTFSTIFLFFFVNWTFVITTTIISSPFNDVLSERIEKNLKGQTNDQFSQSIALALKNFIKKVLKEARKLTFLFSLTILTFIIGFIPFLAPIAAILTCLLLASGFLDYIWSRHSLGVRDIIREVKGNVLGYGISGAFFFILTSIPVLNLLVSPWATSYYTMLWVKDHEYSSQISG
jgi:CysZ protein